MRIVFAGTPDVAAKTLEALIEANYEIALVLTRPDAPVGRKRVMSPSPVAQVAQSRQIPVVKSAKITEDVVARIANCDAELGVVVAFGAILSAAALSSTRRGWVNLHYSLLPRWRGAAPVQHALLSGDRETGVTLFQLDSGMDTGPIFASVGTVIEPTENSQDLLLRLRGLGVSLLLQELPRICSGLGVPSPQPIGTFPIAPKIVRSQAEIDWSKPAKAIENAIRAFNPEPGAHTVWNGLSFRILDAVALGASDLSALSSDDEQSTIVGSVKLSGKLVTVTCGGGTLLALRRVQPTGKLPMPAADWFRGVAAREPRFGETE